MKTAGQLLQEARAKKRLELNEVSKFTKIREVFLTNIEADDYTGLPSGTIARGFIRNYSEFLGLKPDYVLAVFRRDFVENPSGRIIPRGMVEPIAKSNLWTPRSSIIAVVVLIFVLFGFYLIYQYRVLTGPPNLTIAEPQVTESTVEISGRTDPEAAVSVNGQLISLEKAGKFSFRLPLNSGDNQINIVATGKSGKTTSLTRTVVVR